MVLVVQLSSDSVTIQITQNDIAMVLLAACDAIPKRLNRDKFHLKYFLSNLEIYLPFSPRSLFHF